MNIAIEDIEYFERMMNEKPCEGKVWKMAMAGKSYFEIGVKLGLWDATGKKSVDSA